MTTDYRRGNSTRPAPKRRQGRSCVWWFLLGAMTGMFGVGLYWMLSLSALVPPPSLTTAAPPRPAPPPPSFQFPNILRDTEVDIGSGPPPPPPAPRPEPPQAAPSEPAQTPTAAAGSGAYLLQVGSFNRASDAERVKAQLALLGISSRVETFTAKSGKLYHRVRTGPYPGKQAAADVRARLKREGMDSMEIPIK